MPSWVRYSVSVYLGLLLAGSLVPIPSATVGSQAERTLPVQREPVPPAGDVGAIDERRDSAPEEPAT